MSTPPYLAAYLLYLFNPWWPSAHHHKATENCGKQKSIVFREIPEILQTTLKAPQLVDVRGLINSE